MAQDTSPSQVAERKSAPLNDHIKLRVLAGLIKDRIWVLGPASTRTPYAREAAGQVMGQLVAARVVSFEPDTPSHGRPDYCGVYHAILLNSVLTELAHRVALRIEAAEGKVVS